MTGVQPPHPKFRGVETPPTPPPLFGAPAEDTDNIDGIDDTDDTDDTEDTNDTDDRDDTDDTNDTDDTGNTDDTDETLHNLYYTFVYPYLIYGVEIWGNACNVYLDPLEKTTKEVSKDHYIF